ncbi:unnamed protein product [Peronospora belbahrii]|uniref:RING-type E3 ubiquitin transferase n=1 Tax=Peronospora belbahrii TaxID=622444 RepID=A0ABN8D671_9STRA|nr:unnamed protein product [Peronospora belbahrii]
MRYSISCSPYSISTSTHSVSNHSSNSSSHEYIFETFPQQFTAQELNDLESEMKDSHEDKYQVSQGSSVVAVTIVPSTSALCRFFVLGKCRYGSRCTFSHTLPAHVSECTADETVNLSAAAALVDCPFFLRGNCKFGDHCRLRHNSMLLSEASVATAATTLSVPRTTRSATCIDNQRDLSCGICFDDIVQSGKYFGLLSCDHCFCLDCLRSWRQSKDMDLVRACPACRLPSDYIVPSLLFCIGDEKRKVVEAYKSHLALRECKYFNGLFGSCPFGPRCFYAHRDGIGRDVKHLDRPKRVTKPRRGRNGLPDGDSTLQSLLQQYNHLFRFFEAEDWDDFDLVGDTNDSDDSDEDYIENWVRSYDYDTE